MGTLSRMVGAVASFVGSWGKAKITDVRTVKSTRQPIFPRFMGGGSYDHGAPVFRPTNSQRYKRLKRQRANQGRRKSA